MKTSLKLWQMYQHFFLFV